MSGEKTEVDILFEQARGKQLFGHLQEAEALYRQAMALRPTVAIYNNLACVLKDQERHAEAEALFRKIMAQRPHYTDVRYNLVGCMRYESSDHDDVRIIKSQLAELSCTPEQRMYLLFSLGKIFDDCDRYDEAFNAFAEANAIKDKQIQFNPNVLLPMVDKYIHTFDKHFFSDSGIEASASKRTVFIVGMPRSGKSLLEKLLSQDPRIYGAGELSVLDELSSRINSYPDGVRGISAEDAALMATLYLGELQKRAPTNAEYVIDTMPGNFRHLGLIWRLFPNARIFHCTRDPLDTGLYTYFRCFQTHNIYSYNLEHIGRFYNACKLIMHHWHLTLPMQVHEVRYETLVNGTRETMEGVYRFLALQAPETGQSVVPLHARELGRWKSYSQYLGPLVSSLQDVND